MILAGCAGFDIDTGDFDAANEDVIDPTVGIMKYLKWRTEEEHAENYK